MGIEGTGDAQSAPKSAPVGSYTKVSATGAGSELLAAVVNKGLESLTGQDAALAGKYARMEQQSANVEDINLMLKALDGLKERATAKITLNLSDADKAALCAELKLAATALPAEFTTYAEYAAFVKKVNDALDTNYRNLALDLQVAREAEIAKWKAACEAALEAGTPAPPLHEYLQHSNIKELEAKKRYVQGLRDAVPGSVTEPNNLNVTLTSDEQAVLDRLRANEISLTVPAAGTSFRGAEGLKTLVSLRAELSTAQTQQGQLNETLSLELNEIIGKRSAVLTQLQTILQSMLSARSQIARQM